VTSTRVLDHRRGRRRLRARLREVRDTTWIALGALLAVVGILAAVVCR